MGWLGFLLLRLLRRKGCYDEVIELLVPIIRKIVHFLVFGNGHNTKKVPEEAIMPTSAARITRLEADVLDLATSIEIIRNKVLRKIQTKPEEESAQALNTPRRKMYGGGH